MAGSLKDAVYQSILNDIVNEEYTPFQILSESYLTEKYKCSKAPVREALQILCNNGVLRSIPRCGYEVLPVTPEETVQMLYTRFLIESGFLLQVVEKIQPEQLRHLEALNVSMSRCLDDMWKFWDLNTEFHLSLIAVSGNDFAYAELDRICSRLKLAYAQLSKVHWRTGSVSFEIRHHRAILAALEQRDLARARQALQTDLEGFGGLEYQFPPFFPLPAEP